MDKLKRDFYSVETAIKMFERRELRLDHPNQRTPDTWTADYRDGYAATIIKGEDVDPIKICEEKNDDGKANQWVIDGGHRIDTLWRFKHNAFKIGKKIARPIVEYTDYIEDENGEITTEVKTCDIRGKYYKDLPDKLKEDFDGNQVQYVKHLDCTNEEIVYHIVRYNKQKSMNTNENIVARMTKLAPVVKGISKGNRFFKDYKSYSETERKNGAVERCVVESVMCMYHLDNWKKPAAMADYIDENATKDEFDTLNENLIELQKIVPDSANKLFTVKDSFIWFTVYKRFKEMENDLRRFGNFLSAFANNEKLVSGLADIKKESNSTKDKNVVESKLEYILDAMVKYLHINIEETRTENVEILDFVKDVVDKNITQEDIELYEDVLNDLTLNVDNNTKLLEASNKPSLISIVAYGFVNDIDLDDWFVSYFESSKTYIASQNHNYIKMKNDLEKYISDGEVKTA